MKERLWQSGTAYERYMGRWSRRIAPRFLDWLRPAPGGSWLDVGCGTGVLCAAILECCEPGSVAGIDPSREFLDVARATIDDDRFACAAGSADALVVADASFDYVVSGLVLNFVPDRSRAMAETARALRRGGRAACYVWDYAGHMQMMRYFFDVASRLDPKAREYDDGIKAPVCRPGPLQALFADAGMVDVAVQAIDIPTAFDSFEEYWAPFLGGTGSAPRYLASLAPDARDALRETLRRRIPTGPDGEILLVARAWAVQGMKRAA